MFRKKQLFILLLSLALLVVLLTDVSAVSHPEAEAPLLLTQTDIKDCENGKTLQLSVSVRNQSRKNLSGEVILACYNSSGSTMLGSADRQITVKSGTIQSVTLQLNLPKSDSFSLKVFVWDNRQNIKLLSNILVPQKLPQKAAAVTLSIEKRTIGKGDLLSAVQVPLQKGDTAWTLLKREMDSRKFSYTVSQAQGSVYISCLAEDGEMDHGPGSGWMYSVNGSRPDVSLDHCSLRDGDILRIRYTTNLGSDLDQPLVELLKQRISEAETKAALNSYTASSLERLQEALENAKAIADSGQYASASTEKELVVSHQLADLESAVCGLEEIRYPDSVIPQNFADDLWLQYDFKELKVGQTASLYPRRIPQIVSDPVENDVQRPLFRFEIVEGNSISIDKNATHGQVMITAKTPGVSVLKVTYDAMDYAGTHYGACADINAAYVVFAVSDGNSADTGITIAPNTEIQPGVPLTSYDTLYYSRGSVYSYSFAPAIRGADSVSVTCNGKPVSQVGGRYILPLENRSNIIGVTMKNSKGVRYYYQVIDARKIEIKIANKTNPGQPLKAGDTAVVSFTGISNPVAKLAGIYNPTWHNSWTGTNGTYVEYTQSQLSGESFKGACRQWDLATNNDFEVICRESGSYTFTGGRISSTWWGMELGADKSVSEIPENSGEAPMRQRIFCRLPDFTITVG